MNKWTPHQYASMSYFGKYKGFDIYQIRGFYIIPQFKGHHSFIGSVLNFIDKIIKL